MNKVMLIGRIVRDPEIRAAGSSTIAKYTLAVDRKFKKDGEPTADFINCVAWGKLADFAEKYLTKGTKVAVEGRIQTGSYTNKDGNKVYTTDVLVDSVEFCESRTSAHNNAGSAEKASTNSNDFVSIASDVGIENEFPFT